MQHKNKVTTSQTQVSYDNFATWEVVSSTVTVVLNSDECPEIVEPLPPIYDWETEEICIGFDRYMVSSQTVSYDNGNTKTKTGIEYQYFLSANSSDCGYEEESTPQYKWVKGETCIGYDKYETSGQQVCYSECNNESNWISTGVIMLSLDTDGQPKIISANSKDCGYNELENADYRWVFERYECDNEDPPKHYKYIVRKLQIKVGDDYVDVDPLVEDKQLVEINSEECGYKKTQYKWENSGETFCENCNLYQKQKQYVSNDGGATWNETNPLETQDVLIERNAQRCCNESQVCCGEQPETQWVYEEGCCNGGGCNCSLSISSGSENMDWNGGTVIFSVSNSDCTLYAYEKELILDSAGFWTPSGWYRNLDKTASSQTVSDVGVKVDENSTLCCEHQEEFEQDIDKTVALGIASDGNNMYIGHISYEISLVPKNSLSLSTISLSSGDFINEPCPTASQSYIMWTKQKTKEIRLVGTLGATLESYKLIVALTNCVLKSKDLNDETQCGTTPTFSRTNSLCVMNGMPPGTVSDTQNLFWEINLNNNSNLRDISIFLRP